MFSVGMLACGLDVQITLDIPLTIVSAVVAILFTFAAFSSGYASEAIENSGVAVILSKWSKSIQSVLRLCFCGRHVDDLEAGSLPIAASEAEANERRPMLASFSDHGGHNADEEEEQTGHNSRPWDRQDTDEPPPLSTESESAAIPPLPPTPPLRSSGPLSSPKGQVRTLRTVLPSQAREGPNRTSSGRTSEESASTPLNEDSSEESASLAARRLSASSHNVSLSDTTLSSHSWSEPLHAGLSREARIRIKAQSRDRPVPEFGWKYWLKAYYKSITFLVAVRATIWGIAIVFMHYCGESIIFTPTATMLTCVRHVGYGNSGGPYLVGLAHSHSILHRGIHPLFRRLHCYGSHGSAFFTSGSVQYHRRLWMLFDALHR